VCKYDCYAGPRLQVICYFKYTINTDHYYTICCCSLCYRIPKSIDNDIDLIDRSFGFMTAVEAAQDAIRYALEYTKYYYLLTSSKYYSVVVINATVSDELVTV
jgi:hypothetical protein